MKLFSWYNFLILFAFMMFVSVFPIHADNPFFFTPEKLKISGEVGSVLEKSITIRVTSDDTKIRLYSTDLVDSKTGLVISSKDVLFDNQDEIELILNDEESRSVKVYVNLDNPGSFSGKIFVVGNEIDIIPITVASTSLALPAFLIILAGFLGSVTVWTIKAAHKVNGNFDVLPTLEGIQIDFMFFKDAIKNPEVNLSSIKYYMIGLKKALEDCNVLTAQSKVSKAKLHLEEIKKPTNFVPKSKLAINSNYFEDQIKIRGEMNLTVKKDSGNGPLGTIIKEIYQIKFSWLKYLKQASVWKRITLNAGALIVVFVVGTISIFQQDTLSTFQTINSLDVLVLATTGIGIYHVKELISLKVK